MVSYPRFRPAVGDVGDLIDLTQWRLNDLPDESSDEDWDDDPVLIGPDGRRVETWREGYPYGERMERREYEVGKRLLQIELLKLQGWVKETGQKLVRRVRGPGRGRQGRHDQAVHRAPQPARRPGRGAGQADRARAHAVVLPALRRSTCRRPGRSCCSTGPGTTAPASSA